MPTEIISPNMNLPVPVPGTTPGPQYATDVSNSLNIIDAHNHSPGKGAPVSITAIAVDANFSLSQFSLLDVKSLFLANQTIPLIGTNFLSDVNGDLFFNDGSGNSIRITQSGGIAGAPGSIAGLVPPASVVYVLASHSFVFQFDAAKAANLDAASIVLRNNTLNSEGITLQAPSGLALSYDIVLPSLPASFSLMTIDPIGNIGTTTGDNQTINFNGSNKLQIAASAVDNNTIGFNGSNEIFVRANSLSSTQIVPQGILQASIANNQIDYAQRAAPNYGYSAVTTGLSATGAAQLICSLILTTHGKPVLLVISGPNTSITYFGTGGATITGNMAIQRNGSNIAVTGFTNRSTVTPSALPVSITTIDTPPAGVHLYQVVATAPAGSVFNGYQLMAFELG